MSILDLSEAQRTALEVSFRTTPWKKIVKKLKGAVERVHPPLELPPMIRRWLEVNRGTPRDAAEAEHVAREARAIQWWVDAQGDGARWFGDKTETAPIAGGPSA